MRSTLYFSLLFFLALSCATENQVMQNECNDHLLHWGGLSIRENGTLKEAPQEDQVVAKSYPLHYEKGPWTDSTRITILSLKSTYEVGEDIRVIHVVESIKTDYELYIMGPKTIYGEHVDGELASPAVPQDFDDPLIPSIYNGAVETCPAVDYNYDITIYSFDTPGEHTIQWDLGDMKSNVLKVTVK